jgi:hypothetical protein
MNEITLSLCKKPIIGVVLWLSSFCASNQALKDAYIDIDKDSTQIISEFDAPMDEEYILLAILESIDNLGKKQEFKEFLCRNENSLSLSIEIEHIGKSSTREVVYKRCSDDVGFSDWNEVIMGKFLIKKGKNKITIKNEFSLRILASQKFKLVMRGASSSGFP